MLTAVIIDNEPQSITALKTLIETHAPEITIAGIWTEVDDAVKGIRETQPDLVFLDVELKNGQTGFDVLDQIRDRSFDVIFVSAYDRYAIRAFQFSAVYYLEKPVDSSLLREAVTRVMKKRSDNDLQLQLQTLRENLLNKLSLPRQIILPNPKEGDSMVVAVNDIIRVEAANTQAIFYFFRNGKIEKTMYSLNIGSVYKKMLNAYDDFIMIHESHLINRQHISRYNSKNHSVMMADETSLRIAERRYGNFLEKFNLR
ncbi:MAG TPA: response regulator transcription factor [Chitinophagales bacterium]|nr:response regulator transcription factor [Chitinophagales bacterium]